MPYFKIVSRWDLNRVLYEGEAATLADLVSTAVKAGSNLAHANLAGANLARAYLAGANLAHADLADANLADADLADANLAGADLARADLARAYLAGAYLACANLACANLADADLVRAYLAGAYLAGANLAGADLADANLADADLADANLARANLAGAYLACAYLACAYLACADGSRLTLIGERSYFEVGPIGSRLDRLVAWLTNGGCWVRAGCWWGPLDEFEARIADVYPTGPHGDEYRAAVEMIKAHARLWTPESVEPPTVPVVEATAQEVGK